MSGIVESTVAFGCAGESLHGIVAAPAQPGAPAGVGVVVVVGGPQYRAGAHRQFVQLARALAEAGHPVLRFDVRGMGDSSGSQRSFESLSEDIGAAVGALQRAQPGVGKVVLWGLCDGASAALLYLNDTRDKRIAGLCLVNPWVRSEASLARTHVRHYYLQRLLQPAFWRKLASGGVGLRALRDLGRSVRLAVAGGSDASPAEAVRDAPYQDLMARACQRFDGPVMLLLSDEDYTAKEFADRAATDPAWRRALARPNVARVTVEKADHTLSDRPARLALEAACVRWLAALVSAAPAASTLATR